MARGVRGASRGPRRHGGVASLPGCVNSCVYPLEVAPVTRSEFELFTALDFDAGSRRRVSLRVARGRQFGLGLLLAIAAGFAVPIAVIGLSTSGDRTTGSPPPAAMSRLPLYPSSKGEPWLTMPLPPGWSVAQKPEDIGSRAGGGRAMLIANVPIDDFITGQAYPAHLDWTRLPPSAVAVEVRDICGGAGCTSAAEETSFPLRWSDAQPLTAGGAGNTLVPSNFDARQIVLRYFGEGHVLITYVGSRASVQDRALADSVVGGIAPAPLPASGVVHDGWLALGAFSALPADQPVFGTLPTQASLTPAGYYVIRHGPGRIAHPMLYQTALGEWCTLAWDASTATFSCSGRDDRWDRYGRATSPNTQDVAQFTALVKDGNAYFYFNSIGGGRIRLPGG